MTDSSPQNIEVFSGELREELLSISGLVVDASWSFMWDNDVPNWQIRRKIDTLIQRCVERIPAFSMYLVKRHGDCGHRDHRKAQNYVYEVIESDGYSLTERGWLDVNKLEKSLWAGDEESCCPCYKSGKETKHYVLYDIVTPEAEPTPYHKTIASAVSHLFEARDRSQDGRPRSGIREQLLLGVFALDAAAKSDGTS